VLEILEQLAAAADWRVAAQDRQGGGSRREDFDAGLCFVCLCEIGCANKSLGDYSKAIEYYTHYLATAKGGGRPVRGGQGVRKSLHLPHFYA
jgi:hypothetical protein